MLALLFIDYWVEKNDAFEFEKRRSEFWAIEIAQTHTEAHGHFFLKDFPV